MSNHINQEIDEGISIAQARASIKALGLPDSNTRLSLALLRGELVPMATGKLGVDSFGAWAHSVMEEWEGIDLMPFADVAAVAQEQYGISPRTLRAAMASDMVETATKLGSSWWADLEHVKAFCEAAVDVEPEPEPDEVSALEAYEELLEQTIANMPDSQVGAINASVWATAGGLILFILACWMIVGALLLIN